MPGQSNELSIESSLDFPGVYKQIRILISGPVRTGTGPDLDLMTGPDPDLLRSGPDLSQVRTGPCKKGADRTPDCTSLIF